MATGKTRVGPRPSLSKMQRVYLLVQVDFAGKVEVDEGFDKATGKWNTSERPLELNDISGDMTADQDNAITEVLDEYIADLPGTSSIGVLESDVDARVVGFLKDMPRNKVY